MSDSEELRKRAAWYREIAECASNPTIWAMRLRTAEKLEAEAGRLEYLNPLPSSTKQTLCSTRGGLLPPGTLLASETPDEVLIVSRFRSQCYPQTPAAPILSLPARFNPHNLSAGRVSPTHF
jgi:hypothetical protein